MGVIILPKLLELYKELFRNYRNEYGILIIREGMSKEEIQNVIDKSDYIRFIIRKIEEDYIAKDIRCITAKEVDKFISLLNVDESTYRISNLSVTATIYTLYLIAIQLMEKK